MSGAMQFSRGYTVLPDISQSVSVMPGVINARAPVQHVSFYDVEEVKSLTVSTKTHTAAV
jgi:hypothetical protein